ncbi:phage portal protein [Bradyrhizobium zhanjiangense]|uniref:Phage portal protein n=1 Tax=Bradyrhizobium zhanjiangense TaxID=1325107 RepID=A0ABY0DG58_9BRAD|nr:phage portal protein [Bradyrhizobium zhanjiangense]RXG91581.1 phage portal protein [Bradyrhizobium zhanjiangense]
MTETTTKPRYRVQAGRSFAVAGPATSAVTKAEGEVRPGPWYLPITGGWLPAEVGSSMNWWQLGYDPISFGTTSAMVEACVSAYAQTVAMCPGDHWRANDKGGRDRVTTSALSRILRQPNDYQSISDFLLNGTRSLYLHGNAYALALRNDRYEIDELHLMDSMQSYPRLATTGDIFYQLSGNDVIDRRLGGENLIVPQRDVLHIRLQTVRSQWPRPLVGESPIVAAYGDVGIAAAITAQQMKFYMNEARPSAVLSTDLQLDKDQVQALRDRWNEQSKGLHQGGTPILTAGLKVQPWAQGGKDAATADILKLSNEHIALAFRIPLQVLGLGGTNLSSTELLMQSWIASGLGFALNHIEEAVGLLFGLRGQPDEYVEFDTAALLRSAMKDRIEALARGVQGGIYAPNEARNYEGLDAVEYGDEPRVQQQVVPLSAAAKIPAAPAAPAAPPAAAANDDAVPPPPAKGDRDAIQREVRNLFACADRIGRRRTTA